MFYLSMIYLLILIIFFLKLCLMFDVALSFRNQIAIDNFMYSKWDMISQIRVSIFFNNKLLNYKNYKFLDCKNFSTINSLIICRMFKNNHAIWCICDSKTLWTTRATRLMVKKLNQINMYICDMWARINFLWNCLICKVPYVGCRI